MVQVGRAPGSLGHLAEVLPNLRGIQRIDGDEGLPHHGGVVHQGAGAIREVGDPRGCWGPGGWEILWEILWEVLGALGPW